MDESEYHQAMLEREQMLLEALTRAEAGQATEEDWKVIRYECGVGKRLYETLKSSNKGEIK